MSVSLSHAAEVSRAAEVQPNAELARDELLAIRREEARRRAALGLTRGLLTESQVWGLCQACARQVVRTASAAEVDALASELAERMYRRAGVTGKRGERLVASGIVSRDALTLYARRIARDSQRWRDSLGESLDDWRKRERREAGEDRGGFLTIEEAERAGLLVREAVREDATVAPLADHLDRLAEAVAHELAETPGQRAQIRAAVLVAHGAPVLSIAVAEGVSMGAIKYRAHGGRLLLAMHDVERVASLVAHLADVLNLRAAPPSGRPQVSAAAMEASAAVDAVRRQTVA